MGQSASGKPRHNDGNIFQRAKNSKCCGGHGCLKLLFVILAIVIVVKSIALIVMSVATAITTKIFGTEQSGRLAAMIILAVTAAATLSAIIYATFAVFKKKVKPLHATAIVLIILILIQAIIAGVAVKVTSEDEHILNRSLLESFTRAKEGSPQEKKIWAATQNDLTCCGVYSPEDYRRPAAPGYFPPDIPISCCPTYDPDRSELVQERAREICRSRSDYYQAGCKGYVLQVFKDTATWVLSVTTALIILEIIEVILIWILVQKTKNENNENPEDGQRAEEKPQDKPKTGK